jgi:hypothetical protein
MVAIRSVCLYNANDAPLFQAEIMARNKRIVFGTKWR